MARRFKMTPVSRLFSRKQRHGHIHRGGDGDPATPEQGSGFFDNIASWFSKTHEPSSTEPGQDTEPSSTEPGQDTEPSSIEELPSAGGRRRCKKTRFAKRLMHVTRNKTRRNRIAHRKLTPFFR